MAKVYMSKFTFSRYFWAPAFLFTLLSTYFSEGYHHPDEHFQILEWAHYWMAGRPSSMVLAWEHQSEIRPWLQPFLHVALSRGLEFIGNDDRFFHARVARLVYGLLNLWVMAFFTRTLLNRLNANGLRVSLSRIQNLILGSLWFLPYIHTRTSSENLAGIFTTWGFAVALQTPTPIRTLLCGGIFGLACVARPQMMLGLVGFLAFDLWAHKPNWIRRLFWGALGLGLSTLLGAIFDRIGYGHWVFTPYRYFDVNLVQGVAATFNPYPWYQYFIWMLQLLPWTTLPLIWGTTRLGLPTRALWPLMGFLAVFILGHFALRNKEYRFLFPIMNLIAILGVIGFPWERFKFWCRAVVVTGIVAGGYVSLKSASTHFFPLFAVHDLVPPTESVLSVRDIRHIGGQNFYVLKHPQEQIMTSHQDLIDFADGRYVYLDFRLDDPNREPSYTLMREKGCTRIRVSHSDFVIQILERIPAAGKTSWRGVFLCPNRRR